MFGKKFNKPLQDDMIVVYEEREYVNGKGEKVKIQVPVEKPNDAPNTLSKYAECAKWCNENGAKIEDKGDYYECVSIPEPTAQEAYNMKASGVRSKRDVLIAGTDYLLMSDYPIDHSNLEVVKKYRQELRDITNQRGFPSEVIWPDVPEFLCEKTPENLGLAKVGL